MKDLSTDSLGEEFHVASRNSGIAKRNFRVHQIHYETKTQQLVSDAPRRHEENGDAISLDPPDPSPLSLLLNDRHSRRDFSEQPMDLSDFTSILATSCRVRQTYRTSDTLKSYSRPYPNSGNLGSIEIYPIVLNVSGIDPGIYHYDSVTSSLSLQRVGQFQSWVEHDVFYQREYRDASAVLVLTSAIWRLREKYGERGWRFGYLDAGHVSQNLNLAATERKMLVCTSAGFIDTCLERAIGADGINETAVLTVLIGTPHQ